MRIKNVFFLLISLFAFNTANAQKGGIVYYLKNSGRSVSNKDNADYSIVVLPPDTSVDKNLYRVYEYYKDGKLKLTTNSKTNDINLQYHGRYMAYFPNGKKMRAGEFEYGVSVGHQINYYPNGKFYKSINYLPKGKFLYNDLRDSTGKVLAENGTGNWVEFDEAFKNVIAEGFVKQGTEDSVWLVRTNGQVTKKQTFEDGVLMLQDNMDGLGPIVYGKVDKTAAFVGGTTAMLNFIQRTLVYPSAARLNGTQGKVLISFIVNADGTTTDVQVARGIGDGCDEAAVNLIKKMPKWLPGIKNGKPVRLAYSMPINFAMAN